MTTILRLAGIVLMWAMACPASAQSPSGNTIPVTVDNFIRAESDMYFAGLIKDSGGIGKFSHRREPARIDNQTVIRLNRDTLYSSSVFDLDAGPVTITMPDAGKRFMSLMIISEDHYVPSVTYDAGPHTFTKDKVGTRYMSAAVRTLVDPADPKDLTQVHALQDAIKVSQKAAGTFEAPNWDPVSQKKVRDALLVLASTKSGFKSAFGTEGPGRSGQSPDRNGGGLGRQSRQGRDLSQRDTGQERRRHGLQAQRQERAGRTASGRSASTTSKAISRKTPTTPIQSTTSPPRRRPTARSPSSSAAATAKSRTACRS